MKTYTLYYNNICLDGAISINKIVIGKVTNYTTYRPTKTCHSWNGDNRCTIQTGHLQYKYQLESQENNLYAITELMRRCSSGKMTSFEVCDDMYTNGETLTGTIASIRCDTLKGDNSHLVFLEIIEAGG